MKKLAKFEKVSLEEFQKTYDEKDAQEVYDALRLPCRATEGSCGYDFFAPFELNLTAGKTLTVPTGIRVLMPQNWALFLYPRSGLGFKYRLRLNNTVGVIDSDYAFSDNEGHIFVRISNEGEKDLVVPPGEGFCQGVFNEYGLTVDDDAGGQTRNGGFGSTGKSK